MKPQRLWMRRAIRGCGGLLALLLLGGGVAAWWYRENVRALVGTFGAILQSPPHAATLETTDQLLAYLEAERSDVALVSAAVAPDGTLIDADALVHQQDTPMPLASTIKIVLLAGYAAALERGELRADEPVALADWQRYYLPNTDGGAHRAALAELKLAVGPDGFAADPNAEVPLSALVRAMIRFSDNAASDYLHARIGDATLAEVIAAAGMRHQDPPQFLVGSILSWTNHTQPQQRVSWIAELHQRGPAAIRAEAERLTAAYADPAWRQAELRWRDQAAPLADLRFQAEASDLLTPRGTAGDYARLMAAVATGTFISPAVSATMREYLEWPMEIPGNAERFTAFGAKGGSLPGTISDAFYFVPRTGPGAGQPRVVVLMLRDIPLAGYLSLTGSYVHQEFMLHLGTDPTFEERVRAALAT